MVAVEIVFHLRIFRFGAEQEKIEVTDSKEKVYLFDEKGQLHHWFSLPGDATSVSLEFCKAQKTNLLKGNGNGSIGYNRQK